MSARESEAARIFLEAVEHHERGQWADFVKQASGGDPLLVQRVDALLKAHGESNQMLDGDRLHLTEDIPQPSERPGTIIGPYKLLEQIGEGGMGLVFVAEQQHPVRRRVALKIIKPGMDSLQVIARFEAERQALAMMDHPNIAKVHHGGTTTEGRPYFVMELVKGTPITEYCDQQRLPNRRRLELFLDVCHAVQHAHLKGIIHRDIKPSNVLVEIHDVKPVVKVIDFGIAKAIGARLTEKTLYTGVAQMVGTPMYMSPEQAGLSSLDVDTRSDMYSLGVLLYELLTGTTPFDSETLKRAGYDEMRRIIREDEPPRPSARFSTMQQARLSTIAQHRGLEPHCLSQHLRGELDWIVMKALEKDRDRRYESASAFAADVQRYLNDEPVHAFPPSKWYRFRKVARRNRQALAVACLIVLFIVSLGAGVGWVVRDRAVKSAETARLIATALDESASWQEQRRLPEALSAARRADGLLAGAEVDEALRQHVRARLADLELLEILESIRLEESTAVKDGHFDWERVNALYTKAFLDMGLDILGLTPEEAGERLRSTTVTVELAAVLDDWVGSYRKKVGKNDPDWKHLLRVARAADPDPWRTRVREAIEKEDWKALRSLAVSEEVFHLPPATLAVVGRNLLVDAEKDRAIEAFLREAQRRHPDDFWLNHNLGSFYLNRQSPRSAEALPFAMVAVALRPDSSAAHTELGNVLRKIGRLDEAIAEGAEAVRVNPHDALSHISLSASLAEKGRVDEAIAECHEAIRLNECLPLAYNNLGIALQKMGARGREDAIAAFREAIKLDKNFAEPHYNLGNALRSKKQWVDAVKEYREAIRIKEDHAEAYCNLGNTLLDMNKLLESEAACRKAIELNPDLFNAYNSLGAVLTHQGKLPQAVDAYRKAIELKPDFALAYSSLGNVLMLQNNLPQAEDACRKAINIDPHFDKARYNLGLILQNQKRLPEAEAAYRKAIELNPGFAEAHCNLGHTLRQQGRFVDALEALKKGHELGSSWNYPSAQWVKDCELLAELDDKLLQVLRGKIEPSDVRERLALAQFCLIYKRQYVTAYRFHCLAFAQQPASADDPRTGHRYNAARAAALAACGKGKDADKLDAKECADLRQQSLKWLRADLAAWRQIRGMDPEKVCPVLLKLMQHWQQDKDFDGVRDSAALTKLPAAERQDWQKLWAEVDQLRKEATKPAK
jgi:serine/threonine protein kinase/tetratricopeptide (TPR) repeat protein